MPTEFPPCVTRALASPHASIADVAAELARA
jgi:hypothetical protein